MFDESVCLTLSWPTPVRWPSVLPACMESMGVSVPLRLYMCTFPCPTSPSKRQRWRPREIRAHHPQQPLHGNRKHMSITQSRPSSSADLCGGPPHRARWSRPAMGTRFTWKSASATTTLQQSLCFRNQTACASATNLSRFRSFASKASLQKPTFTARSSNQQLVKRPTHDVGGWGGLVGTRAHSCCMWGRAGWVGSRPLALACVEGGYVSWLVPCMDLQG